jgi:hypothetical protein
MGWLWGKAIWWELEDDEVLAIFESMIEEQHRLRYGAGSGKRRAAGLPISSTRPSTGPNATMSRSCRMDGSDSAGVGP